MSNKDFYQILGVSRNATKNEIKSAFRKLAMENHPDRNQGNKEAERKFKEVNEAYQVLMDDEKRAAYDRFGSAAFEHGEARGGFGQDFGDFMSDIFDNIFGEGRGATMRNPGGSDQFRGANLRYDVSLTLEEAYSGKKETVSLYTYVRCEPCGATGARSGSKPKQCSVCRGLGRVRATQGFFAIERTCTACDGTGQVISDPCTFCKGEGRVMNKKVLTVPIPAGVDHETRIKVSGEGECGSRGGKTGDLFLFVTVKPHRIFKRQGNDLFCTLNVSIVTAALSGEVMVTMIDGSQARLKIPEGTQNNSTLRMKDKGMPQMHSQHFGDLYVQIQVDTPKNLNSEQKKALKAFGELYTSNTSTDAQYSSFTRVIDAVKGVLRKFKSECDLIAWKQYVSKC